MHLRDIAIHPSHELSQGDLPALADQDERLARHRVDDHQIPRERDLSQRAGPPRQGNGSIAGADELVQPFLHCYVMALLLYPWIGLAVAEALDLIAGHADDVPASLAGPS